MTKVYELKECKTCGLRFLPVDWLPHRVEGYCREKCAPEKEQQETTPEPIDDLFAELH